MTQRSRKLSTISFLMLIFLLMVGLVGYWLYEIYIDQTEYSNEQSAQSIECGRFAFAIDEDAVVYESGVLSMNIDHRGGKQMDRFTFKTSLETKTVNVTIKPGTTAPVSVPIRLTNWVQVYPTECEGLNFKNISFLPNIKEA